MESLMFRGRRSRNKVSVGEPAEGSFTQKLVDPLFHVNTRVQPVSGWLAVGFLDLAVILLILSCQPKGLKPSLLQISAMDLSAQTTMKSTANCDKHCELQNSEKHQTLERALHSRDIPESNPASVSHQYCHQVFSSAWRCLLR